MRTIDDVKIISFKRFSNDFGILTPLEVGKQIPFEVKRSFYVSEVPDENARGKHAHYKTQQLLICLRGKCDVTCRDGVFSKVVTLNDPSYGVFVPEMIWDEQIYHSPDTILLSFSSTNYDREDYIEDWDKFISLKNLEREER